jgi:hypothetical protein
MAHHLGVPLAPKKLFPPSTSMDFLAFTIDSISMTISLPIEKRLKYLSVVRNRLKHPNQTKRDLLSTVGKLMHAAQALPQARPFLRRLINRAHSVRENRFFVRLRLGDLEDLQWWAATLSSWLGTQLITFREWRCPPDLSARSDASGSIGFGLICGTKWTAGTWTKQQKALNIAVLELVPLVVAAKLWGGEWTRRRILFQTDNDAIVKCAKSWLPKDDHLTKLFKELAKLAIAHSFEIKVEHIAGKLNTDADDLSRGKISNFLARNPLARALPEAIPPGLIEELTNL